MGPSLGLCLANKFLPYHEKKWLNNCLDGFNSVSYQCHVDDMFVFFKSSDPLKDFQEFRKTFLFLWKQKLKTNWPFSMLKL